MADGEVLSQSRGPFSGGYVSSVPSFMVRPDQLFGQTGVSQGLTSSDCVIDPFEGGVSRRAGCAIVGDTLSSGSEVTGILNKAVDYKARKFFALDSPSMSDSYPVPCILYGEDTNAGFPTADSGFPGTIYVRSSNSGADAVKNYSLLEEFSDHHYDDGPVLGDGHDDYNLKVVPIWIESGDGVYNRGALTGTAGTDKFMQQFLTCGSRSLLQGQNWIYAPNLRCTPWRWNKRLNESDSTGTEVVRIFPTGPFPPLFAPHLDSAALSASANNSSWSDGDTFCLSVAFQFEDGSFSMPMTPRLPNATLTGGNGFITVGTIGASNKYQFLTYRGIPVGPHGTVARVLLRTPKQNRTAATDTVTVEPLDLRVIGVLRNNTQTTWLDYGGDDDTLVEDTDVVRFDLVCPRRARFIGSGDQRAVIGYTLPNTAAIMLALTNINAATTANRDVNLPDTDDNHGYSNDDAYLVRITSTNLELLFIAQGASPNTGGGGNTVQLSLSTYDTLEKLVDAINATTTAGNAKSWSAQLAPGIDGTLASTSLTLTSFTVSSVGTVDTTTTLTSSAGFGSVGVGMKVSGTGITAGSYVVSKASASSLTISTAASATGSITATFYQETGDNEIVAGGTVGYMRCFGPNYPLLLHMKPSAMPGYDRPDKQAVYYTQSSPGALSSGVSLAPNSFLSGGKNTPTNSQSPQMQRMCMGIVDIEGAAVVAYTDGIFLFKNARGGNSGEDFDCRLYDINNTRGCISYLGLVAGNGWAAYPTTQGIVVTDKSGREFTISGDIFNPSKNLGDLAYEIGLSAASAASDSDNQYLSAAVIGSRLRVAVRQSSADPIIMDYDFSPGVEASGIEELIDPEKKQTYIWSPPTTFNRTFFTGFGIGAMGVIRNASGAIEYIAYDSNRGTGDGRLEQVFTGTDDNGASYTPYALVAPFVAAPFKALLPQRLETTHRTLTGTGNVDLANDQDPTFSTGAGYTRALGADTSRTQYQKQVMPIAQGQRGKTDMLWARWRSTSGSTSERVWTLMLEYLEAQVDGNLTTPI